MLYIHNAAESIRLTTPLLTSSHMMKLNATKSRHSELLTNAFSLIEWANGTKTSGNYAEGISIRLMISIKSVNYSVSSV